MPAVCREGCLRLYSDAQIVVNISDCIGDSQMPVSGVKQGCPLSPTLVCSLTLSRAGGVTGQRLPGSPFSVRMVAAACSRA